MRWVERRLHHLLVSPWLIAAAGAILFGADQGLRRVGGHGLLAACLDEPAHLLTGLFILLALFRGASPEFALGVLAGSVLIDADHLPGDLGDRVLTAGTGRPYTHSLLMLGLILLVALAWRRRRGAWLGVGIGIAGHLFRDLAENATGVSLLWPWSDRSYTLPHWIYLAVIALLVAIALARSVWAQRGSARLDGSKLDLTPTRS